MNRLALFVNIFLFSEVTWGQAIDAAASFRMIDSDAFVRLHYENDFFSATDYYYSQGINLEIVHPVFKKFFLNKILVSAKGHKQEGIAFEHNGFTPTSTDYAEILYGDRPYAGTLTGRVLKYSSNDSLRKRVTSSLTLGVIGPAAGGQAMQSTIHQWINDSQPLGWPNQIQNDVVINYEASLEKNLLLESGTVVINGFGKIRAGTLSTKLSSGLVLMFGRLNPRIATCFTGGAQAPGRKLTFHFYLQPMVNLVGYDATLQGGVFNKSSPYTISSNDVTRFTFQSNAGVVVSLASLYLEYFQTYLTREFETGMSHQWGGVRVGVKF